MNRLIVVLILLFIVGLIGALLWSPWGYALVVIAALGLALELT